MVKFPFPVRTHTHTHTHTHGAELHIADHQNAETQNADNILPKKQNADD